MRKLLIASLLAVPAAAFAGGYVVPNVNARDLAMAGAAVAAQDTAAAAYANPAALAKLDGLNLSIGGTLIDFRSTYTDTTGRYGGGSTTMIPKGAFPPAIYAAFGGKLSNEMRYGVGAGLTVPGGGFVFWPSGWVGQNEIQTVDRKVYGIYLTGGFQPIENVRLGGGLVYYRTTEHLVQGANFITQQGQAEIGTSGGQLSYDLSAEVAPLHGIPLTLAVDYKHQAVQKLTGHAHFENVPVALRPLLLDQTASHVLTYPNQLNLGAAVRPIEPLLVTFGWTWERFHVYKEDVFAGDLGTTVIVPRDYKNGYTFRLGGELGLLPALKLRAGILRDISPTRESALSASIPDASSWAYSVGVGYQLIRGLELNAAYFHDTMDSSISTKAEFPGQYDTRANIFSLNVTWKMGEPRG